MCKAVTKETRRKYHEQLNMISYVILYWERNTMKLTESRSATLEGQSCWQQAKYAMRYSDLFRVLWLEPLTSRSGFSSSERDRERETDVNIIHLPPPPPKRKSTTKKAMVLDQPKRLIVLFNSTPPTDVAPNSNKPHLPGRACAKLSAAFRLTRARRRSSFALLDE